MINFVIYFALAVSLFCVVFILFSGAVAFILLLKMFWKDVLAGNLSG